MSKYLFSFFALFVIFADELFLSYMSMMGINVESGMKAFQAMGIAAIAYFLLLKDIVSHNLSKKNYMELLSLIVVMLLYYSTQYFYPPGAARSNYMAHFLSFGSLSIPACLIGIRLSSHKYNNEMMNLLPLFIVIVTVTVAPLVFLSSVTGNLLNGGDGSVFDYQNASYFLAFCFSYAAFYVLFCKNGHKSIYGKIAYLVMFVVMFVCAIGCLMGGGRGAFVYLVLIGIYLTYRSLKGKGHFNVRNIFSLVIITMVLLLLANHYNIFESAGFVRVSESLTSDDSRADLWRKSMAAFKESPILGNGLGSVWWTVGFYSHNILSDLLSETGVIGTTIALVVLIKLFRKLTKLSDRSEFDMYMLILYIGCLVYIAFSCYWISFHKLFLIYGYVYGMSNVSLQYKNNQVMNR